MNINKLIEEIEYYESLGKFKLADKLSKSLYRFAIQVGDTIKSMDGAGVFSFMQKQKLIEEIYTYMQTPQCNKCFSLGLPNQLQILGDFKDLASQAGENNMNKTEEQIQDDFLKFQKWYSEAESRMTDFPPEVAEDGKKACLDCFSLIKHGKLQMDQSPAQNIKAVNMPSVPQVPQVPQVPPR